MHEKEFDNYYEQNIKSIYENGKQISSHRKKSSTVYAYSDSPITDSVMENEMIINKNKEVTKTENYKRKNSNKDIVDDDRVLGEDERHLLKTTQGGIVQNVRICNGHGGVMICRMGQIWVEKSVFSYNSRCVLFQNRFYNCEMTGVFLKDHSVVFIAGNDMRTLKEVVAVVVHIPWTNTPKKMKSLFMDFFGKFDRICRKYRIWLLLLKKSLMEKGL